MVNTPATKKPISLRIDVSVLEWFRRQRPIGYQTLIQEVLQDFMQQRIAEQNRMAGRAQEIFNRYYARCFWHYDRKLEITPNNIDLVIQGLRKYGGREGLALADELCH